MFKKLRNRLILINFSISSVVILITFTAIYITSTRSADMRPPMMEVSVDSEASKLFDAWIRSEREAAAKNLLLSLIVSGVGIELAVIFISYYLAEEAIKPVKEAYESQKVFIANASHEIKTPLAAISANLEAADIKNNHWIDNVAMETEKLTALNSELLTLARTDLVNTVTSEEVNVKELVEKQLKSFEPRMKDIKFKKELNVSDKVKVNANDFSQLLGILMDNAIKYSDNKITLTLEDHVLKVTNDGATISKDALPHVFDRFYQADKNSEGVGLGLSIAKSLADRNHWNLSVKSNSNTTFTLNF
ncbi:HAMP domain-containing histidine kinase [Candidatus Saccharibacteria bacterium]|nr:HAMP domain-containing histidine kinase [Candidatus Saccharibacteria bacterium]